MVYRMFFFLRVGDELCSHCYVKVMRKFGLMILRAVAYHAPVAWESLS